MGDPNTGEVYQGEMRRPGDVGLSSAAATAMKELPLDERQQQLKDLAQKRDAAQPDLRTVDGALSYLSYHAPNDDTLPRHERVNHSFQTLLRDIWSYLPDGPGKTVAVRAINRARMECNSTIANAGQ